MLTQAAETFRSLAPNGVDWSSIAPEIALGVWALYVLLREAFRKPGSRGAATFTTIFLLLFSLLCVRNAFAIPAGASASFFGGMIEQSRTTELLRAFFLFSGFLTTLLGGTLLKKQGVPQAEFDVLILLATAGLMLLAQVRDFILLFVALETMSISMYVLVAYIRHSASSLEAGIKYLTQSGLSSALLLAGIALLFGAAGNTALPGACADPFSFRELRVFIFLNQGNAFVLGGAALVLCGLFFKIAAVPFQIWVGDVYQGAPTPVTAYLGVASKAAGFVLLVNVVTGPLLPLRGVLLPLLSAVAILTILFGNLAALGQQNVKRLMGLSGIAHAGYLLMGVCAAMALNVDWPIVAVYFYLFTYLLASYAIFGVMSVLSGEDDSAQTLNDYAGLMKRDSFLGGILAVSLGSLAGIPPMAGFVAKLFLFIAAFTAHLYWLAAVGLFGVVVSIYYYFNWMRVAVFVPCKTEDEVEAGTLKAAPIASGFWLRTVLTTLALITVCLGFWQGFLAL